MKLFDLMDGEEEPYFSEDEMSKIRNSSVFTVSASNYMQLTGQSNVNNNNPPLFSDILLTFLF